MKGYKIVIHYFKKKNNKDPFISDGIIGDEFTTLLSNKEDWGGGKKIPFQLLEKLGADRLRNETVASLCWNTSKNSLENLFQE